MTAMHTAVTTDHEVRATVSTRAKFYKYLLGRPILVNLVVPNYFIIFPLPTMRIVVDSGFKITHESPFS